LIPHSGASVIVNYIYSSPLKKLVGLEWIIIPF
jgi:hypothetical protein